MEKKSTAKKKVATKAKSEAKPVSSPEKLAAKTKVVAPKKKAVAKSKPAAASPKETVIKTQPAKQPIAEPKKNIFTAYLKAFENYAVFHGRASRFDFWSFVLINLTISSILNIFMLKYDVFSIIAGLYSLAVFIPTIAITVRRLHDINKKGWWILLPASFFLLFAVASVAEYNITMSETLRSIIDIISALCILISAFYLLFLYCKKGDAKDNNYGSPVKESARASGNLTFAIIFFFCAIITLPPFVIGFLNGYNNANNKYHLVNTMDQMTQLIDDARSYAQANGGYQSLNTNLLVDYFDDTYHLDGPSLVNDFDQEVVLGSTAESFILGLGNISESDCSAMLDYWLPIASTKGLSSVSVNDSPKYTTDNLPADLCTCSNNRCFIQWEFKQQQE